MKSKAVREKEQGYRALPPARKQTKKEIKKADAILASVVAKPAGDRQAGEYGAEILPFLESDDPVKKGVAVRVARLLASVLHDATPESLQHALEAPTDAGSAARLLSMGAAMEGAVRALDPLAAAIMRGAEMKQDLLRRAGGVLDTARVAKLLGISPQAVVKRVHGGKLLAIQDASGHMQFPMVQFTETGVVAGFETVMGSFNVKSPWTRLAFLLDTDENVGGNVVIDALRAGDLERVLEAVLSFGE